MPPLVSRIPWTSVTLTFGQDQPTLHRQNPLRWGTTIPCHSARAGPWPRRPAPFSIRLLVVGPLVALPGSQQEPHGGLWAQTIQGDQTLLVLPTLISLLDAIPITFRAGKIDSRYFMQLVSPCRR